MDQAYITDIEYLNRNFATKPLDKGDYENCKFANCAFPNTDLSDINFIECEFSNCDLSSVTLSNTGLKEVIFNSCKILGVHFEQCNTFLLNMEFNNCLLNLSSFYRLELAGINITDCELKEADFTGTDLSGSTIKGCDLNGTTFENTILEKADLRESYNYSIDPALNKIKKAKFSMPEVIGLLAAYDIKVE